MASIPSNGRKYKNVENMCAATNLMLSWETVHTEKYIKKENHRGVLKWREF
jgi:hypothetical protein